MSAGTIFLAVSALILVIILAMLTFLGLRAAILVGRKASFSTWIVRPGDDQWIRGIALYGQINLAWYRLVSPRTTPDLLLPRAYLEVVGGPVPTADNSYIIVRLRSPQGLFTLALAQGDAAGLISWVNSAPPGLRG